MVKVGAGTQELTGTTNSYSGTTTVGEGVLRVSRRTRRRRAGQSASGRASPPPRGRTFSVKLS
ncbi:MAG: autotransporter-associated beta strand repeat-containing protein [Chthoniobacterales bacterium]|nr:autotransporter-associated beta strand repeat-containing protein [Chthoniobacterales bacterium]